MLKGREKIGKDYWGIDFNFFMSEYHGWTNMNTKWGFETKEEAEEWAADNSITDAKFYKYQRIS